MSHKMVITLVTFLFLLFTGCEDTIGSGSYGSTNDDANTTTTSLAPKLSVISKSKTYFTKGSYSWSTSTSTITLTITDEDNDLDKVKYTSNGTSRYLTLTKSTYYSNRYTVVVTVPTGSATTISGYLEVIDKKGNKSNIKYLSFVITKPVVSGYTATIDKIIITSLSANGWDTGLWGTNGDPFYRIYLNNKLIKTTTSFKDISSSSMPLTYNINKDIGIIGLNDTLLFSLMDEDVSEHDTKVTSGYTKLTHLNARTLILQSTSYSYKATVYLTWKATY